MYKTKLPGFIFCPAKVFTLSLLFALFTLSAAQSAELPNPHGQAADMPKKVKVFIVMGQTNTLEMGKIGPAEKEGTLEHAVNEENLFPFLVDDEGSWTVRQDVRQMHVTHKRGYMRISRIDYLTVKGEKIGIDLGIGHQLGAYLDEPVMVLRSSTGNRSLGWDLLPPGSERFEFEDPKDGKTYVYPAYKDEIRHSRGEKGNPPEPPKHRWYAGIQYDTDVASAKKVLEDFEKYYPDATGYEIVGFFWWAGDKDRFDAGHAYRYGKNLATLIKALRKDFNAPDADFVCATLGQTDKENATGNEKMILAGMMAVGNAEGEYSEFKGDVATVYTHPLSMGSSSNAHYSGNAKTYMNVGLAMGEAMVDLLQ